MRKRVGPSTRLRGLTLTEVLVALMIMAAAMVPILKALTLAHHGSMRLERRSTSWLLAQSQLEELRARSVADWNASWTQGVRSLGAGYYGRVSDSGPMNDLRTVRVQTGFDVDGNHALDAGEVTADLSGLIARCD